MYISTTAGQCRFEIATLLAIAAAVFSYTAYRIVYYLAAIRLLEKGYRGISYMPRTSAMLGELSAWPQARQDEFVVMFQKAPIPHRVDVLDVKGHCEAIKWAPEGLEIEVVGSGDCQIFFGVDVDSLECQRPSFAEESTTSIPLLVSADTIRSQNSSEIVPFSSETRNIHFPFNDEFDSGSRIPILIVIRNALVEYTAAFPTDRSTPISNVYQFIRSSSAVVSIKGVYTSIGQVECMVCYDKPSNTIVLPCRHCCVCTNCIRQLREPKCVVCRRHFNKFLFLPFQPSQHESLE
jgi:hypothetical protein